MHFAFATLCLLASTAGAQPRSERRAEPRVPPRAQPRQEWPASDPSGSRSDTVYARRYQVATRLVLRGSLGLGRDELREAATLALQRAAANRASLTFVDGNLEQSRRTIRDVQRSGDYDQSVAGSPRRGRFVTPTDRLELTLTVEFRSLPKKVSGRVLGRGVKYSQREEALKVGLSGRVLSIDRGALAYALEPVWVEKKATRDRHVEASQRATIFGVPVPILPPVARGGGSQSSTSRAASLLQQALDEAAGRLVQQLENSPRVPLRGEGAEEDGQGVGGLRVEGQSVDGATVYLGGQAAARLREGDEILVPVRRATQRHASTLILKGTVTQAGDPVEVSLENGSLRSLVVDEARPLRVLQRDE
jgi:acylphosphatase